MTCANKIDNRKRFYALLAIGKKQLAMDDDTYRCFLQRHGATAKAGKISATTMNIGQLSQAVEAMKNQGFKPTRKNPVTKITDWRKPRIGKITAIWIALFEAGVVTNRSEKAMIAWCASITKKPRLEWASGQDLNACIEGLKSWARREKVKLK